MMIKIMMIMSMEKTTKAPYPMATVISLLASSWLIASQMSCKNMSPWPSILLIMAFNGGMMILYIFAISMSLTEKSKFTFKMSPSLILTVSMIIIVKNSKDNFNENFTSVFSYSNQTIIVMTMIMVLLMAPMMKMTINPFKTMKSSM